MFKSLFGKAASRVVVSVALVAFQSCVFCAFLLCICSVKCKLRFYCAIAYKMYMKCRMPKFSSCLGACVVASNYLNLLKTMRLVNYWFGICLNFWEQKKKKIGVFSCQKIYMRKQQQMYPVALNKREYMDTSFWGYNHLLFLSLIKYDGIFGLCQI